MAHDFLGTYNKSQWDRFLAWARLQLPLIDARITRLEAEAERIGIITFAYNSDGTPRGYTAKPTTSYIGKLLAAYEVLGGNPPHDLRTRLRTQPVFLIAGDHTSAPSLMSNGEVVGERGLADGLTAEMTRKARDWLLDTLDGRFGRLERKIRRALDYYDQLDAEVNALKLARSAATTPDSLEHIAANVEQLFADPNYRAIYNDAGADGLGLRARAPFSSYDVDPTLDSEQVDRTAESYQRQNAGLVEPGAKKAVT